MCNASFMLFFADWQNSFFGAGPDRDLSASNNGIFLRGAPSPGGRNRGDFPAAIAHAASARDALRIRSGASLVPFPRDVQESPGGLQ